MNRSSDRIDTLIQRLRDFRRECRVTTLTEIEKSTRSPFHILIACIISLRTKDAVTHESSIRLFRLANSPASLAQLNEAQIADAIYPAGFYNTKAKQLRQIGRILYEDFEGAVPNRRTELLLLPGVGRKTANLVLGLGFGIPAICVDTHVHRIPNRIGMISTRRPEQTEKALEKLLPVKYWIDINDLLVTFGQNCCKPVSPLCSCCPLQDLCDRHGITIHR